MNKGQINLIYFGRITASKNVDVVIKVLKILRKNGLQARLDLIGGCSDDYVHLLQVCIQNEQIPDEMVCFHGKQDFEYISRLLSNAHYFVFPSTEKKEGHSNSLTEAMAYGVVPIVSKAGFNESICGDQKFVVSEFSPEGFAEKIIEIEKAGEWPKLSHYVYERVITNYTEVQAIKKIKKVLEALDFLQR